ncbi:MAG: demethylmenaquinone methyltransferase [Firmicutes bacterium]|nr:demethylmenaquinone methyltransferase [Bacillota bacterium]
MGNDQAGVKSEFVHTVFADIADRYDVMNSVLSFNQHKLWRRFAMRKMQLREGDHCLDVATGTGDWAIAMAKTVGRGGEVLGLDFCQEMLDVAEPKLQKLGIDGFTSLLHGNAMAMPFPDDTYDVATIGFALRNVPDVLQVIKEMTRVVKPGSMVVSLELSKPDFKPFRTLYYFYFYRILPVIGRMAVGKDAPYRWLPESLRTFPDRHQLARLFVEAGLERVVSYPLTFGICALHIGYKPVRSA